MPLSFKTIYNTSYINGSTGPYDNKVNDANAKYGRNAQANYYSYLNELGAGTSDILIGQNSKPANEKASANFSLKYLPEEKVSAENLNKLALLGAAFEDLGKKISLPVEMMTKKMQQVFGQNASAAAFDTNNDGQIDIAENAAAILVKDMADKQSKDEILKTGKIDLKAADIDGNISQKGEVNFDALISSAKTDITKQTLSQVQQTFKLDEAKNIFAADANNILV